MPFNLCKSEKKRLNELFDHVKELSDTVDELMVEVNAMKIRSFVASRETLAGEKNRNETSTLHKLKKCLEKSLTPIFSRDPMYKVRKKCQQMVSQISTIIPRTVNLPDDKPAYDYFPSSSYSKAASCSVNCKISPTRYVDEIKEKKREENIRFPSQRRKNISKDSQKTKSLKVLSSSSTSSESSFIDHYESYHPHCKYEKCNSLNSRKIVNLRQLKDYIPKNKTTSSSTSPSRVGTPETRNVDHDTVKQQRSVTFVDRKYNIPLAKKSSSTSSNNVCGHHLPDCTIIFANPKTDVRKITSGASSEPENKERKRSRSARCSIDCEYLDKLRSHEKNVCTSTLSHNLNQETQGIKIKNFKKARKKGFESQETQTTLKTDCKEKMCFVRRRSHDPKAKRSCLSAGSLCSLTSCSSRSIRIFSLGTEELGEGSMHGYYKRNPIPVKQRFEEKQKTKVFEKKADNVEIEKLFSSRQKSKTDVKKQKIKPVRRKRTYVISSDIPVRKTDEPQRCNFDEEQENSSSIEDSKFQEENRKQRKSRKKWKKPNVLPKVCEGHQLWNKQRSSPEKHDNYVRTTGVCVSHITGRSFPKAKQLSNCTVQKGQVKPFELTKFRESTSSSTRSCTDETCSLTSDPRITGSDGSITSDTFDRKKTDKGF